ncbi:hypothetical protein [Roseimaritima sediminicola]|uniref:hypothetical protein n=1 Tax=Roseimaritima sediminicola TaxID=2662066 RepID=UPI0012982760|nr:hypothetical protein [Roseimaritima sediminicola]
MFNRQKLRLVGGSNWHVTMLAYVLVCVSISPSLFCSPVRGQTIHGAEILKVWEDSRIESLVCVFEYREGFSGEVDGSFSNGVDIVSEAPEEIRSEIKLVWSRPLGGGRVSSIGGISDYSYIDRCYTKIETFHPKGVNNPKHLVLRGSGDAGIPPSSISPIMHWVDPARRDVGKALLSMPETELDIVDQGFGTGVEVTLGNGDVKVFLGRDVQWRPLRVQAFREGQVAHTETYDFSVAASGSKPRLRSYQLVGTTRSGREVERKLTVRSIDLSPPGKEAFLVSVPDRSLIISRAEDGKTLHSIRWDDGVGGDVSTGQLKALGNTQGSWEGLAARANDRRIAMQRNSHNTRWLVVSSIGLLCIFTFVLLLRKSKNRYSSG